MTDEELRQCRTVAKSLALRLDMLKAKLRTTVISDDVLGLGTNYMQMGRPNADRVAAFSACLKTRIVQTFDGWLDTPRIRDELESLVAPMANALVAVAGDALARHLRAPEAWSAMARAFDAAVKGRVTDFALEVVKPRRAA